MNAIIFRSSLPIASCVVAVLVVAMGCEPLHRDVDSITTGDAGHDSDDVTRPHTDVDVDADTDVSTHADTAHDTTPDDGCGVENGGCGDPAYFHCIEDDDAIHCEPIELCADDNGGCGDPDYVECRDGLGQAPTCIAHEYVLTTTADDWGNPSTCSLRAAIESINTGSGVDGCPDGDVDTIRLRSGHVYTLSRTGSGGVDNATADLWTDAAVTITTVGDEPAVIDATGSSRTLTVADSGDVTIENVDMTGGHVDAGHGGAVANHGRLHLQNLRVYENLAQGSDGDLEDGGFGGGVYNTGHLTLVDVVLEDNTAAGGRGQNQIDGLASPGGGGAGLGGEIFNEGVVEIIATEFRHNTASGGAGGEPTNCPNPPSGTAGNGGGNGGAGGSGSGDDGSTGNFGGGGGGGTGNNPVGSPGAGGDGGFGGGGGGAGPDRSGGDNHAAGTGGFGAGDGGIAVDSCPAGGGGGAGIGGALLHRTGQTVIDDASLFVDNVSVGGAGGAPYHPGSHGHDGEGLAADIFVYSGSLDCTADCDELIVEY